MRVIAIANQKGGCGKTTTSINFAASLALLHKKVLLLDLDPQGHSTCGLGLRQKDAPLSLYDLLTCRAFKMDLSKFLQEVEDRLFVIPTYTNLGDLEEELSGVQGREKRLRAELQRIETEMPGFDYVILDCAPGLGNLTWNALEAADEVIVPIEPSFFSLHGLAKISETLAALNQRRLQPIETHALLTIFDSRTRFSKEVYEEVKTFFREKLFKSIIHESVLFKEAAGAGQSIVRYDKSSSAFRDYFNLAVEYLEHQWDRVLPPKKLGWQNVLHTHYGPRQVPGGILFQALSKNAKGVEIAGDFNNWIPEPMMRRDGDGLWQKVVPITQGGYRYKFIVDGEWQMDPFQPLQQLNAFGTFDSYVDLETRSWKSHENSNAD